MKKIFIITALVISAAGLQAEEHGFQASLTPDIAVHSKTTETSGLTLNIWGESPHHGCTLGFVNGSTGESSGFTWGFFANYDESYTGAALAMVNYSKVKFSGLQWGAVNVANEFHGLQLGMVNYSVNLRGVQIGLANIALINPWFNEFPDKLATGFPFVNWSF